MLGMVDTLDEKDIKKDKAINAPLAQSEERLPCKHLTSVRIIQGAP